MFEARNGMQWIHIDTKLLHPRNKFELFKMNTWCSMERQSGCPGPKARLIVDTAPFHIARGLV